MSVQSELTRIITARNTLRTKAVDLGIGLSTDNLTQLATKYDGIVDKGTPSAQVAVGESYTIQPGYYHGGNIAAVQGQGQFTLQDKTVTPTKSEQAITKDAGYYGLGTVTVNPIPDAYQDVTDVTAVAADVLATKVFVTSDGTVTTGTMQNRGAVSQVLSTTTTSYTVPSGYHNGSGVVSIVLETKSATPTTATQQITPTAGKVLSQVTVNPIPAAYGNATNKTATAADLLLGKTAISWDATNAEAISITGTMANNGAIDVTLDTTTTSYSVPAGYTSGGTVDIVTETKSATPSASSQTVSPSEGKVLSSVTVNAIPKNWGNATGKTADANKLLTGYTAISYDSDEGEAISISGSMPNNGAVSQSLNCGASYTIPAGYHNGSGKVTANSLASQTGVDDGKLAIAAAQVLTGYQGWVNGSKITGTMADNGTITGTITGLGAVAGDTYYTIAAGYTSGGVVSLTSDIETQLASI